MSYKNWLIIAVFLFVVGIALGLSTPFAEIEAALSAITGLEEFAEMLEPLPQAGMFILIFIRNVSVLMISFILSPFFCLIPVLALFVNGWVIGIVSTIVLQEKSIGFLLAGLLPHGVFELPAFIMGEAVALSFGTMLIIAIFKKEKRAALLPGLKQNLKYLVISVGLLFIAAIIETWVTPLLLD